MFESESEFFEEQLTLFGGLSEYSEVFAIVRVHVV